MSVFINPFNPIDPDRYQIWDMLVQRDIEAFIANDWEQVANDFVKEATARPKSYKRPFDGFLILPNISPVR